MLLSVYNAPPPAPQKSSNPMMIILGVCGGGCLLAIVVIGILAYMGYQKGKGLINGSIAMTQNMPKFLNDLKNHDYPAAASLVDPESQQTLTADKIKAMEEGVEAKLGPLQSISTSPSGSSNNNSPGADGQPKSMEFQYRYKLTYEKGKATAHFTFRTNDPLKLSGLVSDFKIEPDSGG